MGALVVDEFIDIQCFTILLNYQTTNFAIELGSINHLNIPNLLSDQCLYLYQYTDYQR